MYSGHFKDLAVPVMIMIIFPIKNIMKKHSNVLLKENAEWARKCLF